MVIIQEKINTNGWIQMYPATPSHSEEELFKQSREGKEKTTKKKLLKYIKLFHFST